MNTKTSKIVMTAASPCSRAFSNISALVLRLHNDKKKNEKRKILSQK